MVPGTEEPRPPFARDWDSILFTGQFRRLQDKTQLFPLPEQDFVHSRLTHSLEVASVGRDLGRWVGRKLRPELEDPEKRAVFESHVGDVTAAACLAHDIGNPPFGHAGEQAISDFFRSEGRKWIQDYLTPEQCADFEYFDGNAQGFRVLTRLVLEPSYGLRLTAATLAAFSKYPNSSSAVLSREGKKKKFGFFQAEKEVFQAAAGQVSVLRPSTAHRSWHRHPLAFLVERADDICNRVMDLEDGCRLGHMTYAEVREVFKRAVGDLDPLYKRRLDELGCNEKEQVCFLRARAISQLIKLSVHDFVRDREEFEKGTLVPRSIPELDEMKGLAHGRLFQAPEVLELELVGHKVIRGLLTEFCSAVAKHWGGLPKSRSESRALSLLQAHGALSKREVEARSEPYDAMLRVTDYVSGMTDRYALCTYRKLTGISLPARFQ